MLRVLLVPSSDYLGHPFPQRHNQIFERLHDGQNFEVHAVRFRLFDKPRLKTHLVIHDLDSVPAGSVATYYLTNMISHASRIRKIIRQESIDVVVLSNIAAPVAYVLMDELCSMEIPVVFDLPDYFPTSAAGYLFDVRSPQGMVLTGTFDLAVRRVMRHAAAVTAPSKALVQYAQRCGANQAVQVPNGISEGFLKLHDGKEMRSKLGFNAEDIVVGYVGSVEFWLDMRNLILGVSLARQKGLKVKLVIVGKGLHTDYPDRIMQWLECTNLDGFTQWLDFVPYEEVPKYIACFDVGTIPFDACNPTAYYAAPNKMWEYLSQMKPVISAPIPETLSNSDCVLIASSPWEYLQRLLFISERIKETKAMVKTGYNRALKNTWAESTLKFSSLISRLCAG